MKKINVEDFIQQRRQPTHNVVQMRFIESNHFLLKTIVCMRSRTPN